MSQAPGANCRLLPFVGVRSSMDGLWHLSWCPFGLGAPGPRAGASWQSLGSPPRGAGLVASPGLAGQQKQVLWALSPRTRTAEARVSAVIPESAVWPAPGEGADPSGCTGSGRGTCEDPLQAGLCWKVALTGVCSLSGWTKTSQPSEAPEDDGWSSAEELINSSDAEEEGRVAPRKLVILGPLGRRPSTRAPGGKTPERDHGAVAPEAAGWGDLGREGSLWLRAHPPPAPPDPRQMGFPEGKQCTHLICSPEKGNTLGSVCNAVHTTLPAFQRTQLTKGGSWFSTGPFFPMCGKGKPFTCESSESGSHQQTVHA